MEANEFRLRNLVQDKKGVVCQVVSLQNEFNDERQVMAWPVNGGGLVSLPHNPIQLTEEWLIRFGFEKVNSDYILFKNDNLLMLSSSFRLLADDGYSMSIKIKYVHQLQNLYFALTGEELKYEN